MKSFPSVTICICTCRRPEGLRRALAAIAGQDYAGPVRVVVIENNALREGEAVCAGAAGSYPFPLDCVVEPAPGISVAQNAALRTALAGPVDFIAMIDDDEWPAAPQWLSRMMATQAAANADIVCGPVEPAFEAEPPFWAVPSRFFHRTGEQFATSNILLRAGMLRARNGRWFDPRLALTGDGDYVLISSLVADGYRFATNWDAPVFEWVPRSRANLPFILLRGVREGNIDVFVPELRGPGMRAFMARLGVTGMKLAYAGNHFFWSPFQPWRFFKALDDLASFCGMVIGLCNYRYLFYAPRQGQPRRFVHIDHPDWNSPAG